MENVMKVLLCYFSGTGNTKMIVNKFNESLVSNGVETYIYKIEDNCFNYNIEEFDLIGIAYPIHAFNAPSIILDFANSLISVKDKKVFILKTSGEPLKLNNISSLKLVKILEKKGYKITNEYHYCMPYNILFRHSDNMVYKMWNTAIKVIPIDCSELLSGKDALLDKVFMGSFIAWLFRIEHWGGRFNGKKYSVTNDCIKCGKCSKICPVNNIKIENEQLIFGNKCIMCMRCSFLCNKNAIKIGLFNKWKVNGPYNFDNKSENEVDKHRNFCKKSYETYLKKSNEKIISFKNKTIKIEN